MNRRRPARRQHFSLNTVVIERESPTPVIRIGRATSIGEIISIDQPYWMKKGISKVFGASPAIVFEPMPPVASVIKECRIRKPNRGWQKLQAMMNGGVDHVFGYDDGECEPQTRGIHP